MLFLRTGLPGSGKTLNTIKELDEEHQADPDNPNLRLHKDPEHPELEPRTIYYHGIPDLKIDKLKAKWVEFDHPDTWFDLPDGSVIVIDESQGTFGTDIGRARVDRVTRFEKHRHHGWDVHLITQHPSLLAPAVRKLVGKHLNFIRPYGRTKGVFRHEYEMCIDAPEKRSNFKMAQESKIEFDSHYFGLYKSATVHTHKKVTPNFVKMMPIYAAAVIIPISLLVAGFWWVSHSAESEKDAIRQGQEHGQGEQQAGPGTSLKPSAKPDPQPSVATPEAYAEKLQPRIADVASSAPRYDEVQKVRDFPRPVCAASYDPALIEKARKRKQKVGKYNGEEATCKCYTQQVTKMDTSFEFCMDVVTNGFFDDTRLAPSYASGNSRGGTLSSPSIDPAAAIQRGRAATSQQQGTPVADQGVTVIGIPYTREPRTL